MLSADLRGVETSSQNDAASLASRKRSRLPGPAVRFLADDEEIAQVGDDHEPVGLEILGDLMRLRRQPGVVRNRLHFDHATLGHLALARRAALELAGGEQSEIRVAGAGVLQIGQAKDPRLEVCADGV